MQTPVRNAFGEVLRERRKERGLTQEKLSFVCDRHRTYISRLERGLSSPTLDTLWKLCGALGFTPSEIIRAVEEREQRG